MTGHVLTFSFCLQRAANVCTTVLSWWSPQEVVLLQISDEKIALITSSSRIMAEVGSDSLSSQL